MGKILETYHAEDVAGLSHAWIVCWIWPVVTALASIRKCV